MPFASIALRKTEPRYTAGALVDVAAEIRISRTQELADPTTLVLTVKPPTGENMTIAYPSRELVRDDRGRYSLTLLVAEAGTYFVYWKASSPAQCAKTMAILVDPKQV